MREQHSKKTLPKLSAQFGLNLAPFLSAIGMMEQWNDGIMGSGLRLDSVP